MRESIEIRGAAVNNLKHLNVDIPKEQLVLLAGVSGSGKSTLSFDTIAAEAGRQWQATCSTWTGASTREEFASVSSPAEAGRSFTTTRTLSQLRRQRLESESLGV